MRKLMFLLIMSLFLINLTSANTIHKQNETLEFSITSNNATECILTTINSPTSLIEINQEATRNSQTFNFTIERGNFSELGVYEFNIECSNGGNVVSGNVIREVTLNGKEKADGIVIAVFTILFILIMVFGIIYFIKSLEHMFSLDLDLIDAVVMVSTYLGLWLFYYISFEYLGNAVINDFLEIALEVGGITHLILPLVSFAVSFIMTNLKFKQKSRITY